MNFAGIGKLFDTQNDQQYFAEYFIHLFEFVRFIWHSYDCTNVFQPNFFESEYENSLLGFLDVFGCLRCFKMNHLFHRRQHLPEQVRVQNMFWQFHCSYKVTP